MGRKVKATPPRWQKDGVWYVPDVGDNQKIYREHCALRDKNGTSTPEDLARLAELEPLIADLFEVRIGVLSHDEYKEIEKASSKHLRVHVSKAGEVDVRGDEVTSIGNQIVLETCEEKIFEARGYLRTEAVLDESGAPIVEGGEIKTETRPITDGKELVAFIRYTAPPEEGEVLEDIYKAIKDRSHLERGLKKSWGPSLG